MGVVLVTCRVTETEGLEMLARGLERGERTVVVRGEVACNFEVFKDVSCLVWEDLAEWS